MHSFTGFDLFRNDLTPLILPKGMAPRTREAPLPPDIGVSPQTAVQFLPDAYPGCFRTDA